MISKIKFYRKIVILILVILVIGTLIYIFRNMKKDDNDMSYKNLIMAINFSNKDESKLLTNTKSMEDVCQKMNNTIDTLKIFYKNMFKKELSVENLTCPLNMSPFYLKQQTDKNSSLNMTLENILLAILRKLKKSKSKTNDIFSLNIISFWLISCGWTLNLVMFDEKTKTIECFKNNEPVKIKDFFSNLRNSQENTETKEIATSLIDMNEINSLNKEETKINLFTLVKLILYRVSKSNYPEEL
jgi:hypothetical protein